MSDIQHKNDLELREELYRVGVIGLGFVGGAMYRSFQEKGVSVYGYDKYKDGGIGDLETCLKCGILFLCLPTLYDREAKEYDKSAIEEVLSTLQIAGYGGTVVLKSTVEPGVMNDACCARFDKLNLVHNPEFLTARTAYHDFHNQTHIVLGRSVNCGNEHFNRLYAFYAQYYPRALITACTSDESECTKIFVNSFYAAKIQIFNEFYLLCQKKGYDYGRIKDIMLKNKWFTHHHTNVPGPDGKLSYGGACFPKDTSALLEHMKRMGTPHMVLENVVTERNSMRGDDD